MVARKQRPGDDQHKGSRVDFFLILEVRVVALSLTLVKIYQVIAGNW